MRKLLAYAKPTTLLQRLAPSPAADSQPRVHPEIEAWAIRAAASNGFGGYRDRSDVDVSPNAAAVAFSDPLASAVVRARRYARRAIALLRLYRRRSRQRGELRQLQALDAATLRDLGLHRSEIDSVHAESTGRAAATRRPVIEHEWFRIRAGLPVGAGASF